MLVHAVQARDGPVVQDSDRESFLALVDAHGAALLAFLRRLSGNASDAEDLFQETAVRVWKNLATRPKLRNPGGWLMTIAYRTFVDWRVRRPPPTALSEHIDSRTEEPSDSAEVAEESDRVQAAISRLPEGVREVILLHYSGGLSLSETAAAMNISVGTVKSRLNSALSRLRSVLE